MKEKSVDMSIGVFDSGMGGISVLAELTRLMPNESYIYYGDSNNAPYGTKTVEEITELSIKACDFLISKRVKAIVVACNTATSASVKILRSKYTIPIIGMEPAIKPALEVAKDKKVVVLATPITLAERKFENLVNKLGANDKVIKVPAPELVRIVESGSLNDNIVEKQVETYFNGIDKSQVGSVVLGCTHFVFLREIISQVAGEEIALIDGNLGTARHLKDTLNKLDLIKLENSSDLQVEFFNSMDDDRMLKLSKDLFIYMDSMSKGVEAVANTTDS